MMGDLFVLFLLSANAVPVSVGEVLVHDSCSGLFLSW